MTACVSGPCPGRLVVAGRRGRRGPAGRGIVVRRTADGALVAALLRTVRLVRRALRTLVTLRLVALRLVAGLALVGQDVGLTERTGLTVGHRLRGAVTVLVSAGRAIAGRGRQRRD